MSPLLDRVPRDVWHRIFLFLAPTDALGPPSAIIPILLASHHMHEMLCACNSDNAHLYASMFLSYCDLAAPRRRLGPDLTTSSSCSVELRDRWACIKRVKHHTHHALHPDVLTDDLCRCFCMLLESDHKNAHLLFQYAGITEFVIASAKTYLSETHSTLSHPIAHVSFLLWLLWLISTYDNLVAEELHLTDELQDRVAPYAFAAWTYADYPPVPSPFPNNSSGPSVNNAPTPRYTTSLFAHQVTFTPPPLTPAAILSFCPRGDAYLLRSAPQETGPRIERAKRLLTTSVADVASDALITASFSTPSERFDDDWHRLRVSTAADDRASIPLSRLFAIISGAWEGRMECPDYNQYMLLRGSMTNTIQSFNSLFVTSTQLSCYFQVFYCTSPEDVLRMPEDSDGILNAWMPPNDEIEMTYMNHGDLRIWDRVARHLSTYKLYHPGQDDIQQLCDVIIIGTSTSLDPGLAAEYTGRVRADGLIIMLRDGSQRGKKLIRGYIHHGRNFVGRWRTTAAPAESLSWEGPFIMGRRDD